MQENERKEIEAMIASVVLTKQDIKEDIIAPLLVSHKSDLKVINAYHEGDLKLINSDLKKILVEVRKHNQRMTKIEAAALVQGQKIIELEKQDIKSGLTFPQEERVRDLEDDNLSAKAIKTWIAGSVSIASVLLGGLYILFQIFGDKL